MMYIEACEAQEARAGVFGAAQLLTFDVDRSNGLLTRPPQRLDLEIARGRTCSLQRKLDAMQRSQRRRQDEQAVAEEKALYRVRVANSSAKYSRALARCVEETQVLAERAAGKERSGKEAMKR